MAIWGSGIYENDTALDVLDYAIATCKSGFTAEKCTQRVASRFEARMKDTETTDFVWLALADVQWNVGELDPYAKSMALHAIQKYLQLNKVGIFSLTEQEKMEWTELQTRLLSPLPAPVQFFRKKPYHCEWKLGDVYCYPLDSPYALQNGLESKCLLLHKIGETYGAKGVVQPIVRVKIAEMSNLPSCTEEFNKLDYVQITYTKYEDRFYPIDHRRPLEVQIAEKAKIEYRLDKFGQLPVFQLQLGTTSKRSIPKKVTYLGNFQNVIPPANEFVPHVDANIQLYLWKYFDELIINTFLRYSQR